MEQLAVTRDSVITSKDRKSIAMLTGSMNQLVGKVTRVQHNFSVLTFNVNARNN